VEPKVAFGKGLGVVITSGSAIVIDKDRLACCGLPALSVNWTTKLYVAGEAFGVPLMMPSVERVKPVGNDPEITHHREPDGGLHVDTDEPYGGVPPDACKTCAG